MDSVIAVDWIVATLPEVAPVADEVEDRIHSPAIPENGTYPAVVIEIEEDPEAAVGEGEIYIQSNVVAWVYIIDKTLSRKKLQAAAEWIRRGLNGEAGTVDGGEVLRCTWLSEYAPEPGAVGKQNFTKLGHCFELAVQTTGRLELE